MEYRGVKRADQIMTKETLKQFTVPHHNFYHCFFFNPHSIDIPLKAFPGYNEAKANAESIAMEKGWM